VNATICPDTGIAYDRAGPAGDEPVVLIHAGVADRRMWDPIWDGLSADRDVIRLDLRGFGDSTARPDGPLCSVDDVTATLTWLGASRFHLVGASFGAGVAVETALTHPDTVASLLLAAPGGSLITGVTPDLRAFLDAEGKALERKDLEAAVQANLDWWVVGPHRSSADVSPEILDRIRIMQGRAFELTADWDDVDEAELEPPAFERFDEVRAPTLVLSGRLDLDAIREATRRVVAGIAGARHIEWPDTAHLPSMERPDDFLQLLRDWLTPTS